MTTTVPVNPYLYPMSTPVPVALLVPVPVHEPIRSILRASGILMLPIRVRVRVRLRVRVSILMLPICLGLK